MLRNRFTYGRRSVLPVLSWTGFAVWMYVRGLSVRDIEAVLSMARCCVLEAVCALTSAALGLFVAT